MNRYKMGRPSQATANTLCQKCLRRGHYSYECTAAQQDRPYVSRPSRTQQLSNPKLMPKIVEAESRKKDPRDEEIDGFQSPQVKDIRRRKVSPSASSCSSGSVSTISTNRSASRTRSPYERSTREPHAGRPKTSRAGHGSGDTSRPSSGIDFPNSRNVKSPGQAHDGYYKGQQRHRSRSGEQSPSRNRDRQQPSRDFGSDSEFGRGEEARSRSRSSRDSRRSKHRDRQKRKRGDSPPIGNLLDRPRKLSPYSKRVALSSVDK